MNKEQQELLDDAYKNYCDEYWNLSSLQDKIEYGSSFYNHDTDDYTFEELTQEEFINKCKTDTEFSEKWGLKIEERELSLLERVHWTIVNKPEQVGEYNYLGGDGKGIVITDFTGIPTKLITITYNDKTIESYE
jgi:hypothetical protein